MSLSNTPIHNAQINVVSGNFVIAQPLGVDEGVDYFHSGKVRRIDVAGIRRQLDQNCIVLMGPIAASVTGESIPVRKRVGVTVFAGTVNGDAVLRIRVTASAADNTIARVVRLVEEAQESKAPTERFIDRFSRFYTPAVVVVAALVAVLPPLAFGGAWSEWVYKGLAILLIGCPCALVISTPAAIAG